MIHWFLGVLIFVCSASALYYHPSDPCNLVPYDYLRTQLCCNGTVYADPPFIYTCCYDFVCYRVNNMPVDPNILHPISRYFPATKPGLASGKDALPGVPVPQGVFAPPDYDSQEPSTLIGNIKSFAQAIEAPFISAMNSSFTFEDDDVIEQVVAEVPQPAVNATTASPTHAEEPKAQDQPKQQQQMFQMPQQLPNFPNFSPFKYAQQQYNPYYIRNQGPVHQYFLPLGKQVWNPFQAMFQQTPPDQLATTVAAGGSTQAPPAITTTQPQPGFIQFLQSMFPKDMPFAQMGQQMLVASTVAEEATTTEAPDLYCDGINLSLLQQANPSLACCAKMVIYDSRLYSCVESETSTEAPAPTTTGAPETTAAPTLPPTTSHVLVPIAASEAPAIRMHEVEPVQVLASAHINDPTPLGPPVEHAAVPHEEPISVADVTTPAAATVVNEHASATAKIVAPAKRSAKLSAGNAAPGPHHELHHLPADFVPLTCGIHDYYIDPSISSKFACCGDAIFDVSTELCEHVWGMYYAMAAVPINEDGKQMHIPARLDCNDLKTYIFGNPSTAANYSC